MADDKAPHAGSPGRRPDSCYVHGPSIPNSEDGLQRNRRKNHHQWRAWQPRNRDPGLGSTSLVKKPRFFSHQRFLIHSNQNPVRPRFVGFHVLKWVLQIDSFEKLGFAGSHTEVDNLRVADYFPGRSLERHAELDGPGKAWRFSGFETFSLFSVKLGGPLFF